MQYGAKGRRVVLDHRDDGVYYMSSFVYADLPSWNFLVQTLSPLLSSTTGQCSGIDQLSESVDFNKYFKH